MRIFALYIKGMIFPGFTIFFFSSICPFSEAIKPNLPIPDLESDPFVNREILDQRNGNFILQWFADFSTSTITFNVTCKTRGYVGLGFSPRGKMSGADIVMGGVHPDGRPYLSDRHAIGNEFPVEDVTNDYTLLAAAENETHTFLSFSRPFDTCDDTHDLRIGDDYISLLWAYGETDTISQYHYDKRGSFDVYLLDPDLTPPVIKEIGDRYSNISATTVDLGDWKVWTINLTHQMSQEDTSYICTFHRVPKSPVKRHIVGFREVMAGERERRHIHHFLVYSCRPPKGRTADEFFSEFVDKPGEICYLLEQPSSIPTQHCRKAIHGWGVGSQALFFPPHVGLPMNEEEDEFVMLQMHYDNPDLDPGITLNFGLEIIHTENLRQFDGGLLQMGHNTISINSPSILVPSHELEHTIYGYCGSQCTNNILPKEGINIFTTILHTHLAGLKIRLHHYRDGRELSWPKEDQNYNFNFQWFRNLREERRFLPGDMLLEECTYRTTDRAGSTTVGGFATRNEMCSGFLWYYPLIRPDIYSVCGSELRSDSYRKFLRVLNETWSNERREFIINEPVESAGLTLTEATSRQNWTVKRRAQLQEYHKIFPHINSCTPVRETESFSFTSAPASSSSLRRSASQNLSKPSKSYFRDDLIEEAEREILLPESEFATIFPSNIAPYRPQRVCGATTAPLHSFGIDNLNYNSLGSPYLY